MKKVSGPEVVSGEQALESPLPAEIQEALGELVGAAREGAEQQFRRIVGYSDLAKLVTAIERHSLDAGNPTHAQRPVTEPAAELATV